MTTESRRNKYVVMLELQGDTDEQLRWLAAMVGRLCGEVDGLKRRVAAMQGVRTRERKRQARKK